MKLYFRQRLFSWMDDYDIFDVDKNVVFEVKGRFSIGHRLEIYDKNGMEVGMIQEKVFAFLPKFEIYKHSELVGTIQKELTFLKDHFHIDYNNWRVEGDYMDWNYRIYQENKCIASISKELFSFTDMYVMDIVDESYMLDVVLVTLAIDAEKCSSK